LSAPFIPAKAHTLWAALGAGRALSDVRLADIDDLSVAGQRVSNPPPLFPKPVAA
jgi:methionyl-tRNA synthetase